MGVIWAISTKYMRRKSRIWSVVMSTESTKRELRVLRVKIDRKLFSKEEKTT